jgi:histidine kinase
VAASNWRSATSNVGQDYSFRPYVQQALARARQLLRHRHDHRAGLLSVAGHPRRQRPHAGLVAIKIALQELEREWLQTPDIVLASDEHGVVFLASQRRLALPPAGAAGRRPAPRTDATRQYADQPLRPLATVDERMDNGGRLVRLQPRRPRPQAACCGKPSPARHPWQLHLLHATHSSLTASRWAAPALAAGWRWRCWCCCAPAPAPGSLRQRSRQELETVLHQHAQELRTAQDGIVQAAKPGPTDTASRAAWSTCPRAWWSSTPS